MSPSIAPKMVVTSGLAFWRTAELNEAGAVARQLESAKTQLPEDLVVGGSFFQEAKAVKLQRVLKGAAKIAIPALAATGIVLAGITALPLTLLAGGLALATGVVSLAEGPALLKNAQDYMLARNYQQYEGLDAWRDGGPPASVPLDKASTPEAGLREMLAANMKDFPSSLQVVHANGHGYGGRYTAGLPTDKLQDAITSATNLSGRPVDVTVLDSCYSANFESLMGMAHPTPGSKFVVAFEDAIPSAASDAGRIPLDQMLVEASDDGSAREAAISMAKVAATYFDGQSDLEIGKVPLTERHLKKNLEKLRLGTDSTVAAIDMAKLRDELHPALNQAGLQLSKALQQPELAKAIATAKDDAALDGSRDLIDLGGFLRGVLEQAAEGSPLHSSLQEALRGLDATLLLKRTGQAYPLSGLSVHTRDTIPNRGEVANQGSSPLRGDHLPQGWVKFIKEAF